MFDSLLFNKLSLTLHTLRVIFFITCFVVISFFSYSNRPVCNAKGDPVQVLVSGGNPKWESMCVFIYILWCENEWFWKYLLFFFKILYDFIPATFIDITRSFISFPYKMRTILKSYWKMYSLYIYRLSHFIVFLLRCFLLFKLNRNYKTFINKYLCIMVTSNGILDVVCKP